MSKNIKDVLTRIIFFSEGFAATKRFLLFGEKWIL